MGEKELKAELEAMRAENQRLKAEKEAAMVGGAFSMKVSEKGAVSVYGLGRFPVTLYLEQWLKLLAHSDDIKGFIVKNQAKLATVADKAERREAIKLAEKDKAKAEANEKFMVVDGKVVPRVNGATA